ncbi:TPA: hypothetical protein G8N70_003183 [Salmonella enterica]|uniref:Uncharacterized protein n=1 Tax=Salmonella enterica TaxID=28901 RepID=A0A744CEK3_SALER|nr:hypothetical protein [Salmonella enterica]HAF4920029.1 hypothetical protein [Salmonella enterica]
MKMTTNAIKIIRDFDFEEDVQVVYANLCYGLRELDPPWGLKGVDIRPLKVRPDWPDNGVTYRPKGGVKELGISFSNRNHRKDSDIVERLEDYISVEFNTYRTSLDLRHVFNHVIPCYIRAFDAYFASLLDVDVLVRQKERLWELPREEHNQILKQNKPRKKGLTNIWQVNYWASEQCSNYFGLTPGQVVNAVRGQVARADVLEGGAYIVVSYDPMSTDEVELITPKLMPLLRK